MLIAGLVFLLAAISVDRLTAEPGPVTATSVIFNAYTLASVLKELAFAILIALLVIVSIEHESRRADRETADRLRREIADDVFRGVFSRDLSADYVDTAISLHLKPSLVRNYVKIDYTFETLADADRERYGAAAEGRILLRSRIEFRLTNVTHQPLRDELRFTNPTWGGALSEVSRIVRFDAGETKQGLKDVRETLIASDSGGRRTHSALLDFEPDASRYLIIEGLLLKEMSDSHTWASFYPTMRADVSVTALPDLTFGLSMNSVTAATEAHRSENGLFGRWEIDGPILRNESIILWWRDRPVQ